MGGSANWFSYRVVRVWQLPLTSILAGSIGLLPFAPLCLDAAGDLPAVVDRMKTRLEREPDPAVRDLVWTCAYFLTGLRYPPSMVAPFFEGVRGMAESSTFLATLAGEARRILLRQGRKRFGPPSPEMIAALEAIEDPDELEDLSERLLDVASWEELLRKPRTRRANGKKKK
jgi:hypothetical protein